MTNQEEAEKGDGEGMNIGDMNKEVNKVLLPTMNLRWLQITSKRKILQQWYDSPVIGEAGKWEIISTVTRECGWMIFRDRTVNPYDYRGGGKMKVKNVAFIEAYIMEVDDPKVDFPIYRRNAEDNWEQLIGESWESVHFKIYELESAFQEAIKNG